MSDEGQGRDGSSHGGAWTAGVIGALLLYVLSPPPLVWLSERTGFQPPEPLLWIFYPIGFAYDRLEPVKQFYKAYGRLIGVDM